MKSISIGVQRVGALKEISDPRTQAQTMKDTLNMIEQIKHDDSKLDRRLITQQENRRNNKLKKIRQNNASRLRDMEIKRTYQKFWDIKIDSQRNMPLTTKSAKAEELLNIWET